MKSYFLLSDLLSMPQFFLYCCYCTIHGILHTLQSTGLYTLHYLLLFSFELQFKLSLLFHVPSHFYGWNMVDYDVKQPIHHHLPLVSRKVGSDLHNIWVAVVKLSPAHHLKPVHDHCPIQLSCVLLVFFLLFFFYSLLVKGSLPSLFYKKAWITVNTFILEDFIFALICKGIRDMKLFSSHSLFLM